MTAWGFKIKRQQSNDKSSSILEAPSIDIEKEKFKRTIVHLEDLNSDLHKDNFDLRNQVIAQKKQLIQLQHQLSMAQRYPGYLGKIPPEADLLEFIERHLKFLIFASHPDRNPGNDEAAEVTRKLIKFKEGE